MSISAHLRHLADEIWEAQHAHPFVTGIGDGTLELERFRFWLRQDYLYLVDYARLFGAAVLKAPDLQLMTSMAQVGHEILHTEMELHRSYASEFGTTSHQLELERKAPTCQGYTDFLLRTATVGDFPELMGALLPCIWGYGEIGDRLADRGYPDDGRFRAWIEMYANPGFQQLGEWCRQATDAVCDGLPPVTMSRVEEAFVVSSRYELAFWDMAWSGECWSGQFCIRQVLSYTISPYVRRYPPELAFQCGNPRQARLGSVAPLLDGVVRWNVRNGAMGNFLAGKLPDVRIISAPHAPLLSFACGVDRRLHLRRGGVSVHKEFRNVNNPDSSAPRRLWSPIYRALVLAVMFGMVFGGFLLVQPQAASAQSAAVVTDYLNLRSEPNTTAGIITVMRPGASVSVTGAGQNGFLPVTHGGNTGWAHADWISVGGSAPTTNTGATGSATVIDGALNLRGGPSTGHSIISVMPGGTTVSLTGEASGGFLGVVYNGTSGWAFADYLRTGSAAPAPSQPTAPANPGVGDTVVGTMVTTSSLNMRSGASTSNTIITTIPARATVEIMGSASGGWYPVRYAGNKGWSHGDWLTTGGGSAPAPTTPAPTPAPAPAPAPGTAIGDTVVGTMYVSTGLNLRSGPGTSNSVITVMPGGATVSVMGSPVSGFYPLTFAGTKGWASGEYLQSTAPAVPTPPSGSAYSKDEIIQIIYAAADKYGQPRADMLRVAQCESVLDPNAVNSSSGASGLFQFMPSTFAFTPFAGQDIFDPVVNANAAGWMWQNGMRNHWVCQ